MKATEEADLAGSDLQASQLDLINQSDTEQTILLQLSINTPLLGLAVMYTLNSTQTYRHTVIEAASCIIRVVLSAFG